MAITSDKSWVKAVMFSEERKSDEQLWANEPTAEQAKQNRFKRIKLLQKRGKKDRKYLDLAEKLDSCHRRCRCLSGACSECGRLFQRAWVRTTRSAISSMGNEGSNLVALSLVLPNSGLGNGDLHDLDIGKIHRQLKTRLTASGVHVALGGIDFSLNEDRDRKYEGFWCPHFYVITATNDKTKLAKQLRGFTPTMEIPRPKKITPFENTARRRSYSMKMHFQRRIGYEEQRIGKNGKVRHCRNTSRDRLRSEEWAELLLLLDEIGFKGRAIFIGIKPIVHDQDKHGDFRMMILGEKAD
jgi:hypothetical protein